VAAPLYYVSDVQINLQIPYETGAGPAVVGINNNGKVAGFQFNVAPSAPGIFVQSGNALNPTASGKANQILIMFITGEGDVTPALGTGYTPDPSTAVTKLPKPRLPVTVTVGGAAATMQFIGIPSGLAGVTQINFTIPANLSPGVHPVVVTSNGVASAAANLTVTQ